MKKIIIIPLLLISFCSFAQNLLLSGGYRVTGATSGQTVKWNGSTWVPADDLGSVSFATVADSTAFRAFNTATAPEVIIMTDSLRGGVFERTYTETADQRMVFTDALSRKWTRLFDKNFVNVTWYGAKPDDSVNDSLAVQLALNSQYNVFIPSGTFNTGQLRLTTSKIVEGRNATLQLTTGLSSTTRNLTVLANNVVIRGITFVGKIASQTSEFSHALCVGDPNGIITSIGYDNIIIENCRFTNVRGDGIMITAVGSSEPRFSSNITVRDCRFTNILRNGISIISGMNIRLENIYCSQIGLFGVDMEPDVANQKCENVVLDGYYGPGIGVGHHLVLNKNITIQNFIIDGNRHESTPAYGNTFAQTGLNIRQTENLKILNGTIRRTKSYGFVFGSTAVKYRRVHVENVQTDSIAYTNSFSKIMQQEDAVSDSSITFTRCHFNGNGLSDQVGFPAGSQVYESTITGCDRLLLTSRGEHKFERCSILLNTASTNDLAYDMSGGGTFKDCYINCDYLIRGQSADNKKWRFYDCDITYSTAAYASMTGAPGTRIILKNNKINGSHYQSAGNGATIFQDKVLSTGVTAGGLVIPTIMFDPENTIYVLNETANRAITIDPEGATTINGASTSTTSSSQFTLICQNSDWTYQSSLTGANNGLTLNGSTVQQGGRFLQNTSQSGRLLYSLSVDSLTNLNFRFNTNGAAFSTGNGATGLRLIGDATSFSMLGTDESAIMTTAGGSGILSQFGRLLIAPRTNNSVGITFDRSTMAYYFDNTEFISVPRISAEANIWLKNTGSLTNVTNSFNPLYIEKLTMNGRGTFSQGGDLHLTISGGENSRPASLTTYNAALICATGGAGTAGTIFAGTDLVLMPRYANKIYLATSQVTNPKMIIGESGVAIGGGMVAARDTLDVTGTVRFEGLPSKTSQTSVAWINGLGQLATGDINPSDLRQQGATTGQVIKWNGTSWAPAADAGGGGGATDLSVSGGTSPLSVNSSTGTDISFTDGSGITMTGTSSDITVTNNLSTGIVGGQSVVGGTASGNNLTLSSTTNATKGDLRFGTSAYKEATNRLGLNTTSPSATLHVTQAAIASVSSGSGTAATTVATFTGTAGGATSASTGTVSGGNGGGMTFLAGNGGAITGTPTTGIGGNGGTILITGGDGGTGTTFGGNGGAVELLGGTGGTGTNNGSPGHAAVKGGNASPVGNNPGGSVFIVGGIPAGTGSAGNIFMGVSPSGVVRGQVVVGSAQSPTTSSNIVIGDEGSVGGTMSFMGSTAGSLTLAVPSNPGNWTWTFPSNSGTNGQVLTTNGSGVLSWTTPSAGSSGYATVQEEGTSLTQRSTINFVGSAATASDNTTKTDVTFDSDVNALASTASTGLYAITGTGTSATRTLTAPAAGITVSNGNGVSGNPTLALANDLSAVEGLSGTGIAVRTATDTWANRSITAGTGISVTNGDGVSGNITIANTQTELNGIYTGSGTVPNATQATLTDDFTLSGTDNVGAVSPLRIVTAGSATDKGLLTLRPSTGTDSMRIHVNAGSYMIDANGKSLDLSSTSDFSLSHNNGVSITGVNSSQSLGINASATTTFTGTDLIMNNSTVSSATRIQQPIIEVAANTTISASREMVVVKGNTGAINLTLNYAPFPVISNTTEVMTIVNSSSFNVTLIRSGAAWSWMDVYGVLSTTDKIIYPGQEIQLIWFNHASSDYWLIKPSEDIRTSVTEQTATTITFDGRTNHLYVPSSATTTTINLPEIVASSPTATQVIVGATFTISIDRSANVTISRTGTSDLIAAHNYSGTQTSIQTTGGTFFSQTFTAVGPNLWSVK